MLLQRKRKCISILILKLTVALILAVALLAPQVALAEDAGGEKDQKNLEYLKQVMQMIKERYNGQVTDRSLIEAAIKGMFGSLDPYTTYFNNKEYENFKTNVDGNYEGIGIMITKNEDSVMITKVFPSSPSEKAGLMAGDVIVSVDGSSVEGFDTDKVSSLIMGEAGSKVSVGIFRNGQKGVVVREINRALIKINPVTFEILKGDIGYIKLDVFNANSNEYVKDALDYFDGKGIKKVILDLRNNPGGILDQVGEIGKYFVPAGLIAKADFKDDDIYRDTEYVSDLEKVKYKLAVLVNEMSASASELLAGAVQDTRAGVLIGTKTFGKAKIQGLIPILKPEAYEKYEKQFGIKVVDVNDLFRNRILTLQDLLSGSYKDDVLGYSKVTIGEYITPSGKKIDGVGIAPDIVVDDPKPSGDIPLTNIEKLDKQVKPGLGDEGPNVYNAEKILKLVGYDVDAPDMKLDKKSFGAVMKFQKDSGLFPYGKLDFATQQKLNEKLDVLKLKLDKQFSRAVEEVDK